MCKIVDAEHLQNVCKPNKGFSTCSYLGFSALGAECLKGTDLHTLIDRRRSEKSMYALGDNCSGPPDFKPVKESIQ